METLGRHVLYELYGCDTKRLNDYKGIQRILLEAAKRAKATIINRVFHQFNPHGVSGVVVIAESHISIHTWPEYQYAAVDFFSCGERVNPNSVTEFLVKMFKAKNVTTMEIKRGSIK